MTASHLRPETIRTLETLSTSGDGPTRIRLSLDAYGPGAIAQSVAGQAALEVDETGSLVVPPTGRDARSAMQVVAAQLLRAARSEP